ncbi:hypothetical protein I5U29_07760 [Stenotrophomonas maltophilia]|nr:hypothetical protein [Stenotrophomonas maltophilia]
MNSSMADGASERLDAQIADALFGQPGMSKLDVANRLRQLRGAGAPVLAARSQVETRRFDSSAEDRFEQFVQAEIARSPNALRELGEYLAVVLDEDRFPAANRLLLQLATEYAAPTSQAVDQGPHPMDTAPRNGTVVRLLVQFEENSTEDTAEPAWTIGTCNDDNVSEDERIGWQFAGWCWTHDHFTEGKGAPVGWLPLIDSKAVGNG